MVEKPDVKILDFFSRVKKKFGSRARGDFLENSDYDIILVSPDFKNIFFTERVAMLYEFWKFFPVEIEPLCYTPEEFERMKNRIGIVQRAIKEGIELK